MRKDIWGKCKKTVALVSGVIMGCTAFLASGVPAMAAEITIDGNPQEWSNVTGYASTDSNVAKWSVAKDDTNLYFYVQQNGGNAWGMPIANTYFDVTYASGLVNQTNTIRPVFGWNEIIFKNGWYGDIAGTKSAYKASLEADKYEVEFSIPFSYFSEENFTISYCGTKVSVEDIVRIDKTDAVVPVVPEYSGIKIDGTFTDWNAVGKTQTDKNGMTSTAMVFDGDWLYIYMEEESDGILTWSGEKANGKFTVYTDTGRNTTFKLNKDSIEGIEGAKVAHSNCRYEIAIPASAVKQYKETISYGYYMDEELLITDVANLQDSVEASDKEFNGIVMDGNYTDWDYYGHDLIQYSTSGGSGGDAEAALYFDDAKLYGHVLSLLHMNEKEFQPFYIRINQDKNMTMQMQLVAVNEEGNIIPDAKLEHLDAGTYIFYLRDSSSGSKQDNIYAEDAPIYGKMYLTVRQDANGKSISDEVEYEVDLEKMAQHYGIDISDMKIFEANYINIGTEWVTIGGTSTGAMMGISVCLLTVAGVYLFRKKKCKVS